MQLLLHWLSGLLQGDAGNSWISGRPVLPDMIQAAQVSLTLMLMSAVVALLLAAMICLPTFRRGLQGRSFRSTGFFASVFTALPEFLLASFLLVVGAVWLEWFPPYGWNGLHYAVLPALAMGIPAGGYLGRIFSDALAATFSENWIITWTVSGISRWHITCAVLKRTLSTVMPLIGLVLVSLTGSAVAVEKVFAIPGLGRATLGAVVAQDLPALQMGVLFLLIIAFMFGMLCAGIRYLILGRALRTSSLPVAMNLTEKAGNCRCCFRSPVALRWSCFCLLVCPVILTRLSLCDWLILPFRCPLGPMPWGVICWPEWPTAQCIPACWR